jgi:hypothetical protein
MPKKAKANPKNPGGRNPKIAKNIPTTKKTQKTK